MIGLWSTLIPLLALVAAEMFFSAAETAFFSLQPETVARFRESTHRRTSLVATLLERQRDLLATILLSDMIISTLFYAGTSLVAYHLADSGRSTLAGAVAVGGLFTIIIVGEVVPKAVAYTFNTRLAPILSVPLYGVFMALQPVTRAVGPLVRGISIIALRAVGAQGRISRDELSMLVDTTSSQGHIPPHEGEMIEEVMSLGETRVREIMVPRVDIVALPRDAGIMDLVETFRRTRRTKVPVYDGDIDHIIGIAYVKNALLGEPQSLADVIGPTYFVPEFKTAENLLFEFQKNRITIAVVVDEYGGTAGIVTLADVAGEIVGPLSDEYEAPARLVEELGPGKYRLAGDLSIKDWEELFDIDVGEEHLSTLGGFVVMLLGRIPRVGDTASYSNIRFTVDEVRRHRIVSVTASVEGEEEGGREE